MTLQDKISDWAKEVVQTAQRELGTKQRRVTGSGKSITSRKVASDTLRKSANFQMLEDKRKISVGFYHNPPADEYAAFVHEGVSGTKKKYDTKFSFKKRNIDQTNLKSWAAKKRVKPRDKDGNFIKQTESNMRSMFFMMGRKISQFGIPPTRYWNKAIEKHQPELIKIIGEHLRDELEQ